MSSPVFAITASRSGPRRSRKPRASFAPPVPPESRTTTGLVGEAGQPHAGMLDLVPLVHGDQERRQLLEDPSHLEIAAIDRTQAGDPPHEVGDVILGLAVVARDQDVLVELPRRV